MSIITDFLAIFGAQQPENSPQQPCETSQLHLSDTLNESELYSSFDVSDIFDEDSDAISDDW